MAFYLDWCHLWEPAFPLQTVSRNIAYITAKHADPFIPDSPEEWLDEFSTFSIYQVLPKIIELWGLNVQTDVESKKTSHNRSADDRTLVSTSLRTARHLHPGSWLTHNRDGERYVRRKQQWWVQGLCTDRYAEGFRFILAENSQLIEWHYIDVTRVCEYTVNHVEVLRMPATNLKSESADGKKHALQMRYLHQSLPHISMK